MLEGLAHVLRHLFVIQELVALGSKLVEVIVAKGFRRDADHHHWLWNHRYGSGFQEAGDSREGVRIRALKHTSQGGHALYKPGAKEKVLAIEPELITEIECRHRHPSSLF